MAIHSTAIIAAGAKISDYANVGPYCIIGENVILEDGVNLHSHVCVDGHTRVGANTEIFPFASIGKRPQDLKYSGEASTLVIGKNNVIREYVTIHPGTAAGCMETVVGDNCLIMIGVHIAHDCRVGSNVILSNNASLAGHVEVGDGAILGGMTGFRQFVRIGRGAMIGGGSMVDADVIPYGNVSGERASLAGLNIVGMKRRDVPKEDIQQVMKAFKDVFNSDEETLEERLHKVCANNGTNDMIMEIVTFIKESGGKVALCMPRSRQNIEG